MSETEQNQADMPEVDEMNTENAADVSAQKAKSSDDASEIEDLKAKLEAAEKEATEAKDQALRTLAEMENLRRRTERDLENAHKFALEKFAQELLPVIDSMEMGVAAASDENADVSKIREGTEMTLKMFETAIDKFGIKGVHPEGETFNPDHHQAMSMIDSPEHEPNTVINVMQKGYLLNDRLVRPAMVVVSSGNSGNGAKKIDEEA